MHELSIAETIIDNVTNLAKSDGAVRVKNITLVIGPLSGIVRDTMEFCWPVAIKKTFLEGCHLIVEEVPLILHCKSCTQETTPDTIIMTCKACGSSDVEIIKGRELTLKNMEIE
ncbi:MAG: hydrogenase maturation nickel metallochaperone HypA [Bacteriovoracaceae bacterium]|nr:hydrogenase maturation nickel metallochaperone HypA [Bacteriovoracaceae bacterium]